MRTLAIFIVEIIYAVALKGETNETGVVEVGIAVE
jgi:hypothetical protein